MYDIAYHQKVVSEDIPSLDGFACRVIERAIEAKLREHPEWHSVPLRQSLRGYRKLRVGDYRVIFRIAGAQVRILIIGHRSWVYQRAGKRF